MEQKIFVIDTNVFVEFLLKQERAEESAALMNEVEAGRLTAYVSGFSIHSIETILDRLGKPEEISPFLDRVIGAAGLRVYQTDLFEEQRIAQEATQGVLDFDDSLQYRVCKMLNAALVSFDHDFDRTDIRRWTPAEILGEFKITPPNLPLK